MKSGHRQDSPTCPSKTRPPNTARSFTSETPRTNMKPTLARLRLSTDLPHPHLIRLKSKISPAPALGMPKMADPAPGATTRS